MDPYKIYLQDAVGKIQKVYVFSSKSSADSSTSSLFSDIELAAFKAESIEVIYTDSLIHKDDSICVVKKKILRALDPTQVAYDELYIFSKTVIDVDIGEVYPQKRGQTITAPMFGQICANLDLDETILAPIETKEVYSYDDFVRLNIQGTRRAIYTHVGQRFTQSRDYLLPANPYYLLNIGHDQYQPSDENRLFSMENALLLNFPPPDRNILYVCLAKDAFDYATKTGLDEEYMCELYFPRLFKRQIRNGSVLAAQKQRLIQENRGILTVAALRLYETVDTLHRIHAERTAELPYIVKGVRQISFFTKPTHAQSVLPLDAIFKQIHASAKIPFIKYNPGNRRENMYRIFSAGVAKNGKKIPLLSENVCMRLKRDMGKGGRQIAFYVPTASNLDLFVSFMPDGRIGIRAKLSSIVEIEELDQILKDTLSPIYAELGRVLQPAGYTLTPFVGIRNTSLDTVDLTYVVQLTLEKEIQLKNHLGCVSAVFDILSDDVTAGAKMRLKRVENYQEMDAQSAFITEIYHRTGKVQDVIEGLMENWGLTEDAALMRYAQYSSEHQQVQGEILENPGFSTLFRILPLKNVLQVEVADIVSVEYLANLDIYIDSILRLSQAPNTTGVPAEKRKRICGRPKIDKAVDKTHVENVVVIATEPIRAQPLVFHMEDEDDANVEEDDEGGLFYEDDGIYEEEGEVKDDDEDTDADAGLFYEEETSPSPSQTGGDGSQDDESSEDVAADFKQTIDGMPLNNPNPFFKRMRERDPTLFLTNKQGKYKAYSRICPSNVNRQPVMLTDEEKAEIDVKHPGSYSHSITYGSDSNNRYHYICPRYWCLLTNTSITEEEVKAGKCGSIIPPNSKKVPKGAYVYEFNSPKEHVDKTGKYVQHYPGFLPKDSHPDGHCLPCCFKQWDSNLQKTRRGECSQDQGVDLGLDQKKGKDQAATFYIMSAASRPLPPKRWGFLPMAAQLFLNTDNNAIMSKTNSAAVKPNTPILLRYGVEQTESQSFLGCMSEIYAYKQGLVDVPTIAEFREILAKTITLDSFLKYHNGSLISAFQAKRTDESKVDIDAYAESAFVKTIDVQDEKQYDFLVATIASYETFLRFLRDPAVVIDHTYLWDIFVDANPVLMKGGVNLAILEITENDATNNIELLCPTDSQSAVLYDPRKETVVLLKQAAFYEPVYLYEDRETQILVKKAFMDNSPVQNIRRILTLVQNTTKKYCAPQMSMPKVYTFDKNRGAAEVARALKAAYYEVVSQVMNFRGQVIGILAKRDDQEKAVYVPTAPSAYIDDATPLQYIDSDGMWLDYRSTRDRLLSIRSETKGSVLSKPVYKVLEDGLVVGLLTETNQFVQVVPPSENVDDDGLEIMTQSQTILADQVFALSNTEDRVRTETAQRISLESQFYSIFRGIARIRLNQFENRRRKERMMGILENPSITYRKKLAQMETMVRELMGDAVTFQDIPMELLMKVDSVSMCSTMDNSAAAAAAAAAAVTSTDDKYEEKPYCITLENGEQQTLFPKRHLISGLDNDRVYFGRLADELVRYRRIRSFMFQAKVYLMLNQGEYQVRDDELFLLQSIFVPEYFQDIGSITTNSYVQVTGVDFAKPAITQNYTHQVDKKEQRDLETSSVDTTALHDTVAECIVNTREVIGNPQNLWRRSFPKTAKEVVFRNTLACSFYPMIAVLQERLKNQVSVQNVKSLLWAGYAKYVDLYREKILFLWRKQGKRDLATAAAASSVEAVIHSDGYYITDLDWWVLATHAKLPIILFSSTTVKQIQSSVDWIHLSGGSNDRYFFVRTIAEPGINTIPTYHLITPTLGLGDLKDFAGMIQRAFTGEEEYKDYMQTLDQYLAKMVVLTKRR